KQALLARLERQGPLSIGQFPLLQVLAPQQAADRLLARLSDPNLDEKSAEPLLAEVANLASIDAGWGLLKLAEASDRPAALRRAALEKIVANLNRRGAWGAMAGDSRFTLALSTLLNDSALRPTVLATVGRLHVGRLGS